MARLGRPDTLDVPLTATASTKSPGQTTQVPPPPTGVVRKAEERLSPAQPAAGASLCVGEIRNCPQGAELHATVLQHVSATETRHSPVRQRASESLRARVQQEELLWGETPLFQRLRQRLAWWERHASPSVVQLVRYGVRAPWVRPPRLPVRPQLCSQDSEKAADSIFQEYEVVGAVKRVSWEGTAHLVPWFLLEKQEQTGTKVRLISDCRIINREFCTRSFRLDHLAQILPVLRRGYFAEKIDLKDAYFHIGLHPELWPFLRHQVGTQVWEYRAGPFGLSIMPATFMTVIRVVEKVCRARGIQIFVYLDDILVIAPSKETLRKHLTEVVETILQAGFKINLKKSVLEPVQVLDHLGFTLNFATGRLEVPGYRAEALRKELGKMVVKAAMSKRQMAAILGKIRSMLVALPFLRGFTDTLCRFLQERAEAPWDATFQVPGDIKTQLGEVRTILATWVGQQFPEKPQQHVHADASDLGWGALELGTGRVIHEFWRGSEDHINVRELLAAINAVKGLAKKASTVRLSVDNQVVYYYLSKGGGRLARYNGLLRPFFQWMQENGVDLQVRWLPSAQNQADEVSRWAVDPGDYSLNLRLFRFVQKIFQPHIVLDTDLFASAGNRKCQRFVSRWPHCEAAAVDALHCDLGVLETRGCFANPPWSVLQKFLPRLREFPSLKVLVVCPWWVSAIWWPQLIKLKMPNTPCLRITPFWGMFENCHGEKMPPPPVEPLLHSLLRKVLEGEQVPTPAVDDFLGRNPSFRRYRSALKLLWIILEKRISDPLRASVAQVAGAIILLHQFSVAQARNAYSAAVLFPAWQGLRGHPLLNKYKKEWKTGIPKYATFWDCRPALEKLLSTECGDLTEVRMRLVVVCRLLCLFRSVDLSNALRTVSVRDGVPYILIKRKGARTHRWERVVCLPEAENISPWHLIMRYVRMTVGHGKPGGPLLLSLKKPYVGLTADRVGSLTRQALGLLGINTTVYGPHSTRGAGVSLYKKLGLKAEEVCEIGQWTAVDDFVKHYQRLGAQDRAEEELLAWVHRTSLNPCAEPEVSRTPPRSETDRGGRDTEGEALRFSEPPRPTLADQAVSSSQVSRLAARVSSSLSPPPSPSRGEKRRRRTGAANSGNGITEDHS